MIHTKKFNYFKADKGLNPCATIALAGNPNVGKSTVFNALTGMHQHTGNWPGKTVANASGTYSFNKKNYTIVDLPGTYSLLAHSVEEEIARDYIKSGNACCTVVVCDATSVERGLNLALQTLEITSNVVVCVNLLDEAVKKGIAVNLKLLESRLGVPVIGTSARSKKGLKELCRAIEKVCSSGCKCKISKQSKSAIEFVEQAELICHGAITLVKPEPDRTDRILDNIFLGKYTAIPCMIIGLIIIFWITIVGANYPSEVLSRLFFDWQDKMLIFADKINLPEWLSSVLIMGIYRVLAWVVSVMLPPMTIFFPLFTLLEDFGYLPRIAFNLDGKFKKCNACGKQALTMCMGLGCNSVGVVGCRIIDSPRERLIAILTNTFTPCNGRFPTLIAIITMFFIGTKCIAFSSFLSVILLIVLILFSVFMTFMMSNLLSKTLLKGLPSSFTLEMPPYRKPQIGKVIVRSVLDRTLFVLGRAVVVAAPAGLLIWIMANIKIGDTGILIYCTRFLNPFAKIMGLDGVILMAFILGIPANEIVIPIIIMSYMATGSIMSFSSLNELHTLLINNGWTLSTAVCTMLFSIMHWPCATTLLTIKKETNSLKWTLISFIVPTLCGIIFCCLTNYGFKLIHFLL